MVEIEREMSNIRSVTGLTSRQAFDQYESRIRMIVSCLRLSCYFPNLYPHVVSGSFRLLVNARNEAHLYWSAAYARDRECERISTFVGAIGA